MGRKWPMSDDVNKPALLFYLSGNKDGGTHEHVAHFSARKVNFFMLFLTVISANKRFK